MLILFRNKRKKAHSNECAFYGGEDGIRTHVAFGQTVFKTASL